MLFLYIVFLLACLGLLVAGIVEQRNHHKNLHSIPHRVLVNGIRGKSSITRLCAGALRGGKLTVVAKTTGTAARFIFPDASEEPVYRKFGIANVVEQIGIVRRAASYFPDVLVIECMAVMPPLQELNQTKLIQSTIGILCNVREDHLAEMGPTLDDVARSLSRSMPVGGVCVTAEKERLHILQEEADRRKCKLIAVDPESVTDEEMRGFTWTTFKENVAIALAVAELLGVRRQDALQGMWAAPPDPGVLTVEEYRAGEKSLRFANIFAANDPESTFMNIQQLQSQGSIPRPLHVLINCRPDRVERNGQMGSLVSRIDPDKVILIGDPTRSARVKIDDRWQDRVVDLGGKLEGRELLDAVLGTIDGYASVLAIGNIHGQGELLLAQLERLERPPAGTATAGPSRREPTTAGPSRREPTTAGPSRREPTSAGPSRREPTSAGLPQREPTTAIAAPPQGEPVATRVREPVPGPAMPRHPEHHPSTRSEHGPAGVSPNAPTEILSPRQVQAARVTRPRGGPPINAPYDQPLDARQTPQPHQAPPPVRPAMARHDPEEPARHHGPDGTAAWYAPPEAARHGRDEPTRYSPEERTGWHDGPDRPPARYRREDPERYGPDQSARHGYEESSRYLPDEPAPPGHGPGAAAYRALAEENLGGSVGPLPGWDDDDADDAGSRRRGRATDPVDPSGRQGPGRLPRQRQPHAYRSNR